MAGSDRRARQSPRAMMRWLALAAVAAPLLVFVAVLGTRFGLWSQDVGRDLLALQIGRWVALAGLAAGTLAVVLAFRDLRRLGLMALTTLLIAAGTVGVMLHQQARLAMVSPLDATTNAEDPPGFIPETFALRTAAQAPNAPQTCAGLDSVPRQIRAGTATTALEDAGFQVSKAGLFQSEGVHAGFWFGLRHDAVIRIRPGRTDVRVSARDSRPQGDAACRLAAKIVAGLQAGS
ncbi:hypothetical protein [uncultured Brevundimonas sp.]|uniref:hypothetical protein n=1 Tax=uncultured Brevundimonas sp. TaxID=213418 RepID=UPI0030ED89F2